MNKKKNLIFFLFLILLNNCSFDNKTGIWDSTEKEKRRISELAKEHSLSSNASSGGLMSWRQAADMPELFEMALSKKPVGFISDPLESGSGFHILKIEDKRGDFVKYESQWLSRHILLMPSAIRTSEETEKELIEIRQRVMEGEDFALLANEFSQDPGLSLIHI